MIAKHFPVVIAASQAGTYKSIYSRGIEMPRSKYVLCLLSPGPVISPRMEVLMYFSTSAMPGTRPHRYASFAQHASVVMSPPDTMPASEIDRPTAYYIK